MLGRTIRNRFVQHFLFWTVSFYVLYRLFAYSEELELVDLIYTFLFHLSIAIVVYVNLRFLIPKYLQKQKYPAYLTGLIVLILTGIFLNMATFNWLADFIFPGYYFIDYYDFTDILEFIFVYLLITSLLKFSKGWFRYVELNQQMSLLEKEKLDAELIALKGQINPHFLFNSLNNLYSLSLDQDKRVPNIVLRLSEMMRYLLYDTNIEKVPLEKELDHLRNFIEMQNLRLGEAANIIFTLNGKPDHIHVAPLLFLPLVENAFKHGDVANTDEAFLNILMEIHDNEIMLKLENKKGGVDEIFMKKEGGIGLANLKRRLQLVYPDKHELVITDDINTYSAILKINVP